MYIVRLQGLYPASALSRHWAARPKNSCCIGKRSREGGVGAVAYGTVGEGGGEWLVPTGWCARDRSCLCFSNTIKEGTCWTTVQGGKGGEKDVNLNFQSRARASWGGVASCGLRATEGCDVGRFVLGLANWSSSCVWWVG